MIHHSHIALALMVTASLGGAAACSHAQPRADEALFVPPGTTSGGIGMRGVEPTAPQSRHGTRSVSLGSLEAPSGGAATTTTATTAAPGTVITVSSVLSPYRTAGFATTGYPGAPVQNGAAPNTVGTVNGDYGPLPPSGDAVPTATYGTPGGVITH
jgi:hypothetical protein